jgi:hypothetical protein
LCQFRPFDPLQQSLWLARAAVGERLSRNDALSRRVRRNGDDTDMNGWNGQLTDEGEGLLR